MAKSFQVTGSAVINKIQVSANARKQLQGLVVNIDTKQITKQLKKVRKQIQDAFRPLKQLTKQAGGVQKLARNMNNLAGATNNANRALKKQDSLFRQVIRKAAAFRVSTIAINSAFNGFSEAVRFTIEFDAALRNINKILRLTDTELTRLGDQIIEVARAWNLNAEEVANAARTAAQAGLGDQADVLRFISEAAKLAATSTLDFATAQESLLAISKQTNSTITEASTILSKFASIEDAAAVEAQQLAGVFNKAGTSISLAFGRDLNKAIGTFAALLERTRQTDKVIGTFAKTALARLSGANESAVAAIRELGIEVEELGGRLRDPIDLLEEVKERLDGLSGTAVGETIGRIFGIRQAELGKALLEVIGQGGRGTELGEVAGQGFVNQITKITQETDKVEAKINDIRQTFNRFVNSLKEDIAIPVIEKLEALNDVLKSILGGSDQLKSVLGSLAVTGGTLAAGALIGRPLFTTEQSRQRNEQSRQARIAAERSAINRSLAGQQILAGGPQTQRQAQFGTFNRALRRTGGLVNRLGRRVSILGDRFAAFTPATAALAVGATLAGEALKDSSSEILRSTGSFVQQFGQLSLLLGAKFGLLAASATFLIGEFPKVADSIRLFNARINESITDAGDFAAAARILRESEDERFGQGVDRQGAIDAVEAQRAVRELEEGGVLNERDAEKYGKVLSDIFNEAVNSAADQARAVAADPTSQRLRDEYVDKLNEVFSKNLQALANIDIKAFQILTSRQGFAAALANATEDARQGFGRGLANQTGGVAGGRLIDNRELVAGLQDVGIRRALRDTPQVAAGLSPEELKIQKERIASEKQLADATAQLLVQENQLIATRTSPDILSVIREEIELKKQLAALNTAAIDADIERLRAAEEQRASASLQQLNQKFADLYATLETNSSALERDEKLLEERISALEQLRAAEEKLSKARQDVLESTPIPGVGGLGDFSNEMAKAENALEAAEKNLVALQKSLGITSIEDLQTQISGLQLALTAAEQSSKDTVSSIYAATREFDAINDQLDVLRSGRPLSAIADADAFISLLRGRASAALQELTQNTATLVQGLEKEIDVQNKRRESVDSIISSTLSLAQAQAQLQETLGGSNTTNTQQQALAAVRERQQIQQASIDAEIALERQAAERVLQIQRESVDEQIRILEELKRQVGDEEFGDSAKVLDNLKTKREQLTEAEITSNERIQELEREKTRVALEGRREEINAIRDLIQAERRLKDERLSASSDLIKSARSLKDAVTDIFSSQLEFSNAIRSRLEQAGAEIKSRRGALGSAFDELANARAALFDALSGGADAFAQYTIQVNVATVAADRLLGKFAGYEEEAAALADAYDAGIEAARAAGASERQLSEIRAEAAAEQLRIYQQFLDDTRTKSERFFASSADERRSFVEGLSSIQSVVGRFQGNIENFRNLNEDQLNTFGSQLISLPQDVRQGMLDALAQLPDGTEIGGLTADEIREVLLGGALGESEEVGIERLSTIMEKVADLMVQSAEAQTAQLVEAQKNVAALQANVAEAREGVQIAKDMLAQSQRDAAAIQDGIRDVSGTINTQLSEYRDEFLQETENIRASDRTNAEKIVAQQKLAVEYLKRVSAITGTAAGQVGGLAPGDRVTTQTVRPNLGDATSQAVLSSIGQNMNAASEELRTEIEGLRTALTGTLAGNLGNIAERTQALGEEIARIAEKEYLTNVQANIGIDNEQKIQITGAAEIVNAVMSAISERGWVTEEQLESISRTIREIINRQIDAGIAQPNAAISLGG